MIIKRGSVQNNVSKLAGFVNLVSYNITKWHNYLLWIVKITVPSRLE